MTEENWTNDIVIEKEQKGNEDIENRLFETFRKFSRIRKPNPKHLAI